LTPAGDKGKMSRRKVAFVVFTSRNSEELRELKSELETVIEKAKNFRCWKHIGTVIVDQ